MEIAAAPLIRTKPNVIARINTFIDFGLRFAVAQRAFPAD
jgi:hypothetical protein